MPLVVILFWMIIFPALFVGFIIIKAFECVKDFMKEDEDFLNSNNLKIISHAIEDRNRFMNRK